MRTSNRLVFVFLSLFTLMPAWANPALVNQSLEKTATPTDVRFIDEIITELMAQKKLPSARRVAQAEAAMQRADAQSLLSLALTLTTDPIFEDYGWYYKGRAELLMARQYLLSLNYGATTAAAERAAQYFLKIEWLQPASSLSFQAPALMAEANFLMSQAAFKQKNWLATILQFEKALERLPAAQWLGQIPWTALQDYVAACFAVTKKNPTLCRAWVMRLVKRYPERSPELAHIQSQLSWSRNFPVAEKLELREISYKSPDKDQLAMDEAMKIFLSEKGGNSDAKDLFINFLRTFPKSKERYRAMYWLARMLEADGEKEQSQDLYISILSSSPYSYYGLLSSLRSGRALENYIDATLPMARVTDPFLTEKEKFRLKRAEHFLAEGAGQAALWELKDFRPRDELSEYFLFYVTSLHHMAENHFDAFRQLGDLTTRAYLGIYSTYGLKLVFPSHEPRGFNLSSLTAAVDPLLVRSLMKQESAFVSDILSSSGAVGLMQIMPFTALDVDPKVLQSDLARIEINVDLGAQYLERVLKKFDGNIVYALAGYNAGPHRVTTWQKVSKEHWGMLEFIESIPFAETIDYVRKIIRNYYWYHYMASGQKIPLNYFWKSGPNSAD